MHRTLLRIALGITMASASVARAQIPSSMIDPRDTTPFAPFRIIDNVYYVGSKGIASFLMATPDGHILVDTGLRETGAIVLDNIATLGFKSSDVKVILSTHAHFDHVAGHALVKAKTGARVYASEADARLLESGGREDFRFGKEVSFDSVGVDRRFRSGDTVMVGGVTLTARITPGHTKGNTMWLFKATEKGRTYDVVIAPSMSINPGVKLIGYAPYPDILRDYTASFAYLETLKPDVFLAPHASFFGMEAKAAAVRAGAPSNPFIDPEGYRAFLARWRKGFDAQLAAERGAATP